MAIFGLSSFDFEISVLELLKKKFRSIFYTGGLDFHSIIFLNFFMGNVMKLDFIPDETRNIS